MVKQKRGQLFIFAAVIISVIVLSMATIANYANTKPEPHGFYDYTYDVRKEIGSVLDYTVYTFSNNDHVEDFVNLLVADIKDKDAGASFMFVYGNDSLTIIENYGADVARVSSGQGNVLLAGGALNINSTIKIAGVTKDVYGEYQYLGGQGSRAVLKNTEEVSITLLGSTYTFPLSKHNQVIFIIQKQEGEETYVSV